MVRRLAAIAVFALTLVAGAEAAPFAATGAKTPSKSKSTPAVARTCTATTVGGRRPTKVHVPPTYLCNRPGALVVALHGFTGSGASIEQYLRLPAESNKRGFLYLAPDGTKNARGQSFWNATPACCNFSNLAVDDSAYVSALITQTGSLYNVDPKKVYVVGYSNGGFMSYRMACEHSDQIAAIASLAGAMRIDPENCRPKQKVSVLQIHGSSDYTISYTGGSIMGNDFPSATTSVATWAAADGCARTLTKTGKTLDVDSLIDGAETAESVHRNCAKGTAVALWTLAGSGHGPELTPAFSTALFDFLDAHPKP